MAIQRRQTRGVWRIRCTLIVLMFEQLRDTYTVARSFMQSTVSR